MASAGNGFAKNVFINCPFDEAYRPLLEPLLFTIVSFGYSPRIAVERSDSGESRLSKIAELLKESNMPFELGVDYGTRLHGSSIMRTKKFLILAKNRYELQKALSDISGFDIKNHKDDPARIIRVTREWFVETVKLQGIAGASALWYRFNDFTADFWRKRLAEGFTKNEVNAMAIPEYVSFLKKWIAEKY